MRNMYLENTLRFDRELCTGCGACVEVCPHAVFAPRDGVVAVVNRTACMECGACRVNCEYDAIAVDSGVGCAAALMVQAVTGRKQASCGG